MKNVAIILAAGSGKRMNSDTKKQFLLLNNKPLLYYSVKAFEESTIDEIIIVTGKDDIDYCENEIIRKYNFKKVVKVIQGGAERYNSVFCGLREIDNCTNVFIHDGARPMITVNLIESLKESMKFDNAVIVGTPVKDTIKSTDENSYVKDTPERKCLWQVQTPQVFEFSLIKKAYQYIIEKDIRNITDDAMALELYTNGNADIKLLKGSYENIKVTTPEDLIIGEIYLKNRL